MKTLSTLPCCSSLLLGIVLPTLLPACTDDAAFPAEGLADTDEAADTEAVDEPGEPDDEPDAGSTGGEPTPDASTTGNADPPPDDPAGSTGAAPSEDPCVPDPSMICMDPTPAGWTGPVAAVSDDTLTASHCGGGFPDLATTAYDGFVAPPNDCACDCGSADGGSCSGSGTVGIYPVNTAYPEHPSSNYGYCYVESDAISLDDGDLVAMNVDLPARFILQNVVTAPTGGSCHPYPSGGVPDAGFANRIDLCLPAELISSCDGEQVCLSQPTAPFDAGVCVWREGIHECPADSEYNVQSVYYRNHTDTRACRECTCGTPGGSCDDARAYVYFGASLVDTTPLDESWCTMINDHEQTTAVRFDAGDPTWGTCAPSQGGATGNAAPADPVTVCCTP
jgi:hypothetical protein